MDVSLRPPQDALRKTGRLPKIESMNCAFRLVVLGLAAASFTFAQEPASVPAARTPRQVKVAGEPGAFRLLVDGSPYFIRGVGFNVDNLKFAEREMSIARDMGFNSLRVWGAASVDRAGLDLAERYGLTVVPAWWLSQDKKDRPTARDYANAQQNAAELEDILEYVNGLKDHPAVLMWGIGNEAYEFGEQGEAFCKFLEQVCKAIHQADPNHPVIYAAVYDRPVEDFAKFTPSLDVFGCNIYSGYDAVMSVGRYVGEELKKPVVVTEFGPPLPQDNPDDTPVFHASTYWETWVDGVLANRGQVLGGYFFVFRDGAPGKGYYGLVDHLLRPRPVTAQVVRNALASTGGVDTIRVAPRGDGFDLRVNDTPYFVRGVSMEPADLNARDLLLAAGLDLNTVRVRWTESLKPGLSAAWEHGLRAVVRIDLQPEYEGSNATGRSYLDAAQNDAVLADVVGKINALKASPAVLMWELGNATWQNSVNRAAFAKFLNRLCEAVHAADPHHPIAHTTTYDSGLRDFAQFTPALDILGEVSQIGPGQVVSFAERAKALNNRSALFMDNTLMDIDNPLTEERKIWNNQQIWRDGVERSRPYALGGFFRTWRDTGAGYGWGFVRKDGSLKQAEADAVRAMMIETR